MSFAEAKVMAFEDSTAEVGPLPLGGQRRGEGTRNARRPSKPSPAGVGGASGWSGGSSSSCSFPSPAVRKLAEVGGPLRHMMCNGVDSMVHAFERDWLSQHTRDQHHLRRHHHHHPTPAAPPLPGGGPSSSSSSSCYSEPPSHHLDHSSAEGGRRRRLRRDRQPRAESHDWARGVQPRISPRPQDASGAVGRRRGPGGPHVSVLGSSLKPRRDAPLPPFEVVEQGGLLAVREGEQHCQRQAPLPRSRASSLRAEESDRPLPLVGGAQRRDRERERQRRSSAASSHSMPSGGTPSPRSSSGAAGEEDPRWRRRRGSGSSVGADHDTEMQPVHGSGRGCGRGCGRGRGRDRLLGWEHKMLQRCKDQHQHRENQWSQRQEKQQQQEQCSVAGATRKGSKWAGESGGLLPAIGGGIRQQRAPLDGTAARKRSDSEVLSEVWSRLDGTRSALMKHAAINRFAAEELQRRSKGDGEAAGSSSPSVQEVGRHTGEDGSMGTADIISRILQERGLGMGRSAHPEAEAEIAQRSAALRPPRPSRSSSSSPAKASLAARGVRQVDPELEGDQVGTQVVDDAEAAASRWVLDSPRSRGHMPSSAHEPWTEEEVASRFTVAGGSLVAGRSAILEERKRPVPSFSHLYTSPLPRVSTSSASRGAHRRRSPERPPIQEEDDDDASPGRRPVPAASLSGGKTSQGVVVEQQPEVSSPRRPDGPLPPVQEGSPGAAVGGDGGQEGARSLSKAAVAPATVPVQSREWSTLEEEQDFLLQLLSDRVAARLGGAGSLS